MIIIKCLSKRVLLLSSVFIIFVLAGLLFNNRDDYANAETEAYEYRYKVSDDGYYDEGRDESKVYNIIKKEPVLVSMVELIDEMTGRAITYPINLNGQTYGTIEPGFPKPDLIRVSADNGKIGYLYAVDYEQPWDGKKSMIYSVYEVDGKSIIGEFDMTGGYTEIIN